MERAGMKTGNKNTHTIELTAEADGVMVCSFLNTGLHGIAWLRQQMTVELRPVTQQKFASFRRFAELIRPTTYILNSVYITYLFQRRQYYLNFSRRRDRTAPVLTVTL
jgi:hypothetical protein